MASNRFLKKIYLKKKIFFPYTDSLDGLHHTQMVRMVKYMVCIIHGWQQKKFIFCNEALFTAPGQGPGAR